MHRKRGIDMFIMVFTRFVIELRLYVAAMKSFSLDTNPIDESLAAALTRLFEIHDHFAVQSGETPGWAIMMTHPERALMSLPEIASLSSSIQEGLRGSLLGHWRH